MIGAFLNLSFIVCICTTYADPFLGFYFGLLSTAPAFCFALVLKYDTSYNRRTLFIAYLFSAALSQVYSFCLTFTYPSNMTAFCEK